MADTYKLYRLRGLRKTFLFVLWDDQPSAAVALMTNNSKLISLRRLRRYALMIVLTGWTGAMLLAAELQAPTLPFHKATKTDEVCFTQDGNLTASIATFVQKKIRKLINSQHQIQFGCELLCRYRSAVPVLRYFKVYICGVLWQTSSWILSSVSNLGLSASFLPAAPKASFMSVDFVKTKQCVSATDEAECKRNGLKLILFSPYGRCAVLSMGGERRGKEEHRRMAGTNVTLHCVEQGHFRTFPYLRILTLVSSTNVCRCFFHPVYTRVCMYEGHLESKERLAIQRYLLLIGKKQNMQVLSHTFTYFST